MAKQKGIIKLEGSIGGMTFYERNRKNLVRTTSGPSKERIENDPKFKRVRENMSEFGGAAKVGKSFRMGFVSIIKPMSNVTIVGRITGLMKRINSNSDGVRGQRSFEIVNNKFVLEGFDFNPSKSLDAIFYAPNVGPTLDVNISIATWVIPDFNTSDYMNAPEGATHFRLLLATTVLSDFTYVVDRRVYEPQHPDENEQHGITYSAEIPLGGDVGSDTTLVVDLGFGSPLPATVGVVNAIGIIFYQEVNSAFYELSSERSLVIATVG